MLIIKTIKPPYLHLIIWKLIKPHVKKGISVWVYTQTTSPSPYHSLLSDLSVGPFQTQQHVGRGTIHVRNVAEVARDHRPRSHHFSGKGGQNQIEKYHSMKNILNCLTNKYMYLFIR